MLCEHCKMREATVQYVEVVNGVRTEHNLCAQCAASLELGQYSALFDGDFSLGKLLSGILGIEEGEESDGRYQNVVCPTCGTTYEEFVKDSEFGCPDCYSVFDPLIREKIRHLQGSEKHVGKRPAAIRYLASSAGTSPENDRKEPEEFTKEEKIELLQEQLLYHVKMEEFEEAAKLRDEIKKLKEEI